ncbi:hypothetical protein [Acidovorax sp. NCPPB 4044]|uniref:hypothetical protein n=1 Tax=Acidovorax sp. NCPPB 4044 TaxID=2940490 RepID=UPI0023040E73|nr:hypothetical protein [Acidovorax sp. NCPPB 4044]MDA8521357.1 hypothetical protein [Acidovorax sp. NCPPB 4044]
MIIAIMWGGGFFLMALALMLSLYERVEQVRRASTSFIFYAGLTAVVAGPVVSTIADVIP